MKRILIGLTLLCAILLPLYLVDGSASAVNVFQDCNDKVAKTTNVCKDVKAQDKSDKDPIIGVLKAVLNIMSYVAGVASIILLIINGFRLIVSNGEANGIKNARNGIAYVLVGVAVVLTAQIIVIFVLDKV